jgi:hypothetical protein
MWPHRNGLECTPYPDGEEIAARDFNGDRKADVASIWGDGLWYQDGDTLDWTKVSNTAPTQLTAGDVTGDGHSEIIGTWRNGIWYWDVAALNWAKIYSTPPYGEDIPQAISPVTAVLLISGWGYFSLDKGGYSSR